MSGELAPKLRVVRCPKCRLLLPESPQYDVYKCGGCGTTLQAKKRKVMAVNSESSTHETAAAPRNALDHVSEDKQRSNRKQLVPPRENGLKAKVTSSSSGESYLDGNGGRSQKENGECNGDQLGPINLSGEEQESELDIYKLSHRRHRVSNKVCSKKITHCEIEEIGNGNLSLEGSKEELFCASDEDANNDESALVGANPEVEITGNDLEGAEELNNGNLLPEGAEGELISGSDEEDANKDKSALVVANPEVEITGSNLEGTEELSNGNLLLEGAEEQLISGSDGEDANNEKSALEGANPEVEITGSDLKVAEELNNGNMLLQGAEEELISGSDGEDANKDKSALVGGNLEVEITGSNIEGEELNNGKLLLEGAEEELTICAPGGDDHNNDQSALVGAKSGVDITESASTTKRSSAENFVSEKGSILRVTAGKLEEGTSGNPVSSNKQQKKAQKNIHHSFDRVRSVDTLETTELVNPSSELSGILGKLPKSSTNRSFYAYDGSVSSYDERFPIQHLDSFENTRTTANGVSEERTRKGKGLVNGMLHGDLGTQHQSYLPNGKHHVMKDSRRNQNKVLEPTRHGHRHWMRRRDEFPSRMPFHRSGSQSCYESGSPSNQMHDELYCSSSFLSPRSCEDTDQEKRKLLRMIYKLQDQLNRTGYMSGETNGRLSTGASYKGKHISAYHSHVLHEGRFSHGLDYPMCNGRCSHGVNWRQRHRFSRIPYSAEATISAHHVDHSCCHCYPKEQHFSTDLPPHVLFQHEDLYSRSHPGQDCCSSHRSYPASPHWLTASKLPVYGPQTKSDDQRHRAPELKKYLRGKQNLAKRHYKPVAGGAPFVTCQKCSKLLQLPADFLLFKRVCHQLKCGECSEVLKFSLQNGSHIVSYSPNAVVPPSSDLNDQTEVINSNNLPSASHANYYHYSHADPISYSDDYGLSVSKSYSSEGDSVSLTQFHPLRGSEYDNPSVSRGTFEPVIEKEKIASRHSGTSKAPVGTDESTEVPSNMSGSGKLSSEMEARPPPKSVTLHELMGYSSPSQVIRGTRSSVEGKKLMLNGENDPSQERES